MRHVLTWGDVYIGVTTHPNKTERANVGNDPGASRCVVLVQRVDVNDTPNKRREQMEMLILILASVCLYTAVKM